MRNKAGPSLGRAGRVTVPGTAGPARYPAKLRCQGGAARFGARAAGGGAGLAVVVLMLPALVGAEGADFGALAQQVLAVLGAARQQAGGQGANVGAVAVEGDAAGHHFHVVFVEARGGAVLAGAHAVGESAQQVVTGLIHLIHQQG